MPRKIPNAELNRPDKEQYRHMARSPFILLLDNVRSMNNIGSVFRTADAFNCEAIGLTGITAIPPHREIHKTALGAEETVKWFYEKDITDALRRLKSEGYVIAAVEQVEGSILLNEFEPDTDRKYVFIFGHEVNGVSAEALELSDIFIEIPQHGTKHSLNISVTAGIVAWHFSYRINQ